MDGILFSGEMFKKLENNVLFNGVSTPTIIV